MSQYEKPPSWSNNYVKEGIVISIMSKMHIVWSILLVKKVKQCCQESQKEKCFVQSARRKGDTERKKSILGSMILNEVPNTRKMK